MYNFFRIVRVFDILLLNVENLRYTTLSISLKFRPVQRRFQILVAILGLLLVS